MWEAHRDLGKEWTKEQALSHWEDLRKGDEHQSPFEAMKEMVEIKKAKTEIIHRGWTCSWPRSANFEQWTHLHFPMIEAGVIDLVDVHDIWDDKLDPANEEEIKEWLERGGAKWSPDAGHTKSRLHDHDHECSMNSSNDICLEFQDLSTSPLLVDELGNHY